jgi:hypothetical protein
MPSYIVALANDISAFGKFGLDAGYKIGLTLLARQFVTNW